VIIGYHQFMPYIDTSNWYNKYLDIPHKHLGDDITGLDCFNLCRLIFKQEKGIDFAKPSIHYCNIVDEDWYNKTTVSAFEQQAKIFTASNYFKKVSIPKAFDIVLLSIGSTNITNHCALYVGNNKIIHTMIDRPSWVSPYGGFYKQYTTGIYRWNNLKH